MMSDSAFVAKQVNKAQQFAIMSAAAAIPPLWQDFTARYDVLLPCLLFGDLATSASIVRLQGHGIMLLVV